MMPCCVQGPTFQDTNFVRPDPHGSVSMHQLTQEKKKYARIITVQHLPINPFPDAFPLSHPCLHNESVAMATVAKQQASQMLLILRC